MALFCRLVGSYRQPGRAAWGAQHWQHFLLVLHAAKRLIGGLWKGVLRDWASTAGARLPLQCVHDLLGNVYNVSYLAELDRLPALLNTRQLLLEQPAGSAAAAAAAAREQAPTAAQPPAEPGSSRSSRDAGSVSSNGHQRGSVSSALRELLVDGPVGPAVDLDDLLAMIMLQFDAGGAEARVMHLGQMLGCRPCCTSSAAVPWLLARRQVVVDCCEQCCCLPPSTAEQLHATHYS